MVRRGEDVTPDLSYDEEGEERRANIINRIKKK